MSFTLSPVAVLRAQQRAMEAGFVDTNQYLEHLIEEDYDSQIVDAEVVAALQLGLDDVKHGRISPAREVFDRLAKKHGLTPAGPS